MPVARILPLPPQLVNQIAAGEIVERPASVVKEMIENAIDAGAQHIEVEIEDAGGKLIRVRDDGTGIHRDDLALAFSPHATSKIRTLDDLEHIRTLGFRGEALPSIAAVAKVTLTSRSAESVEAHGYRIQPHLRPHVEPAPHPFGTTIEIRDLFYNTPARKKFLKSARTERFHIQQIVQNLALSHDKVQILFKSHGKTLGVYGGEDWPARIASVLGEEMLPQALRIEAQNDDMRLWGWVALPTFSHSQNDKQYFFVNGRMVRDKLIVHAIKQAYEDVLFHGRHPVFVLFLDINPELIDVNAHPQKHEVRFRDSQLTHDFIFATLQRFLRAERPKKPVPAPPAMPLPVTEPPPASVLEETAAAYQWQPSTPSEMPFFTVDEPIATPSHPLPPPVPTPVASSYPLGRAIAQIHGVFILAQNEAGLVIVDTHAAHERILYERLKTQLRAQAPEVQHLLLPVVLNVSPAQFDAAEKHRSWLSKLGFILQAENEQQLHICSVPLLLKNRPPEEIVAQLLQELSEFPSSTFIEREENKILAALACQKAVRANDYLSLTEMNQLLRDLENTPAGGQCNHGRPTWTQLDLQQLNGLFLRGQ